MAPNENLTAVLYGVEDLRLENQKVPEITDGGELVVKVTIVNFVIDIVDFL